MRVADSTLGQWPTHSNSEKKALRHSSALSDSRANPLKSHPSGQLVLTAKDFAAWRTCAGVHRQGDATGPAA